MTNFRFLNFSGFLTIFNSHWFIKRNSCLFGIIWNSAPVSQLTRKFLMLRSPRLLAMGRRVFLRPRRLVFWLKWAPWETPLTCKWVCLTFLTFHFGQIRFGSCHVAGKSIILNERGVSFVIRWFGMNLGCSVHMVAQTYAFWTLLDRNSSFLCLFGQDGIVRHLNLSCFVHTLINCLNCFVFRF